MPVRTGVVVLRQAGSAAGVMPPLDDLIQGQLLRIVVIAFPQSVATCREVVRDLGVYCFHAVQAEKEAREIFETAIVGASFLLTGTSSEAAADAFYWRTARAQGVSSIAYLDQWSNIERRFPGRNKDDWPDTLAVIDAHDEKLAQNLAPPGVLIRVTGSPAIERIIENVRSLRAGGVESDANRMVFATEPVEDVDVYRAVNGFSDEECFEMALSLIRRTHPGSLLVMRLHPRDAADRWRQRLPSDIPIEWDSDTRAMCLARAGRVFGMRSFFLIEARASGVPVFSIQPNRRTGCPLTDGRIPVITRSEEYCP